MADQFHKKRKGQKKQIKEALREIAPYRYLIVCEGGKTEPLYFEGIKQLINDKYGDKIKVKTVKANRFDIDGTGRNTEDLVRYTIEKKKNATIPYGRVWCVFDKDSFEPEQFNNAIITAKGKDIECAWSNEAIELWFLLHFEYLNTGISREQYRTKLDNYFNVFSINNGKYEKNLANIYQIVCRYGDVNQAIKRAKKLCESYEEGTTPSNMKPATKVYRLVEELYRYLDEGVC